MPTSGSRRRSRAMRCSALRPCSPNASRSPRTRRTCFSGVTRPSAEPRSESRTSPVWHGRSRAASWSIRSSAYSWSSSSAETSSSDMPVHPDSIASSARYSSATRPTAEAFTRSGRSFETKGDLVTVRRQVAGDRQDAGVVVTDAEPRWQHLRIGVVQLHPHDAARVSDRQRLVETTVLDAQVVEDPQRRPGEVAQLGVGALRLELADDHHRYDHLVLVEPEQRVRVGQQDRGVEDVGASARSRPARRSH